MRHVLASPIIYIAALTAGVADDTAPDGPSRAAIEADLGHIAAARALDQKIGERVWPGRESVPFAVLLVGEQFEYLICAPQEPEGFEDLGVDPATGCTVRAAPAAHAPNLFAAFPAYGQPALIVAGRASYFEASGPEWIVTALHEHFHQFQYAWPDYPERTNALNLAGGDTTGMWMLNYPFPYDDPAIGAAVREAGDFLYAALTGPDDAFAANARAYVTARQALKGLIPELDYRYFAFQLWQEGISRYVEARAAQEAADLPESRETFSEIARQAYLGSILKSLESFELKVWKRSALYPMGAAEGYLLDRLNPFWKEKYFEEAFDLLPLMEAGLSDISHQNAE